MSRRRWIVIGAVLLVAAFFASFYFYDPVPACRAQITIRGEEFWRVAKTNGFLKVKDKGSVITGHYVESPTLCFEITKEQANDPDGRLEGYKSALAFWAYRGDFGLDEAKKLTGISFKTSDEMSRWWLLNDELLAYSPERDVLVIDEYRKRVKPNHFRVDPEEGDEVSNVEYWWRTGSQDVQIGQVEDGFRFFRLKRGDGWITLKVEESRLADRGAKEKGLRKAVQSLLRELRNVQYQEDADAITYKLNKVTDLSGNYEDWMTKLSRHKLVLRQDGECLTAISE